MSRTIGVLAAALVFAGLGGLPRAGAMPQMTPRLDALQQTMVEPVACRTVRTCTPRYVRSCYTSAGRRICTSKKVTRCTAVRRCT
ncbi:MAG: hypothetical protein ABWZ27_07150 [Aestuariivirgaceae bacterium]|jgi:hypothetical protein